MLTSSVIIVVSEVLEAVFLVGLLLGLSQRRQLSNAWLWGGVMGGVLCSLLYALYLGDISDWLDGFGQEIVNAVLLLCVYVLLLICSGLLLTAELQKKWFANALLVLTLSLILTHEVGELLIYWWGAIGSEQSLVPVATGSIIGVGIGFSIGALFYYVVVQRLSESNAMGLQVLLAFVASGLILQATSYLIQADWIESAVPVADLSGWISESSVAGRVLFAVLGYEAQPAAIQLLSYGFCLSLFVLVPLFLDRKVGCRWGK